jgi:hypothetical protein
MVKLAIATGCKNICMDRFQCTRDLHLSKKTKGMKRTDGRKKTVTGVRGGTRTLINQLTNDLKLCADRLMVEDTQFMRRTLFRTAFSMFEALNSYIARKAIEAHMAHAASRRKVDITAIILLSGREYKIAENGKVRSSWARHPFLNFTAFLLKTFAKAAGVRKHYLAGAGWRDFRASVNVRNRITHPKTKRDLIISNAETAALLRGAAWYGGSLYDIAKTSKIISIPAIPVFEA